MNTEELVRENNRRYEEMHAPFNPITGEGSVGERKEVCISDMYPYKMLIPVTMLKVPLIKMVIKAGSIGKFCNTRYGEDYDDDTIENVIKQFIRIRCKHDFPFLAYVYYIIKNKEGGKNIHFKLSYPQRYMLGVLEKMRLAGIPIRVILLKARQWGGSTLIQLYIAWIQLFHKEGWYSAIVAQDSTTSRKIKAMYSKMLEELPPWLIGCPDDAELSFTPYEGSQLDSIITYGKGTNIKTARDTVITVGTYNNPNAGRGGDISCVHYSEVGLWEDTDGKKPEDIIRSISSSLLMAPLTVEVIESTANGMGNFFYRAYQQAKQGKGNRIAVFIPWFRAERNEKQVKDKEAFARWLIDNKDNDNPPEGCLDPGKYYWHLWTIGATFESINWYISKRKDYIDHEDMMSEYPSDDVEAFRNSGNNVFNAYHLDTLKSTCKPPAFIGEVQGDSVKGKSAVNNLHFTEDTKGFLKVWALPQKTNQRISRRYLVIVDVGGRGKKADFSDILVIDRYWMMYGGSPEIVAEWHGHIDHDLLAWKAVQIAAFYDNAYLVIESNTIETKDNDTDGDQSELIFNQISFYSNLYVRKASEAKIAKGITTEYGFHTNRKTKPVIITNMVACVRDHTYIERNIDAIAECSVYQKTEGGKFEAAEGYHDDMVMVRAIGLWICFCEMELPAIVNQKQKKKKQEFISEASI